LFISNGFLGSDPSGRLTDQAGRSDTAQHLNCGYFRTKCASIESRVRQAMLGGITWEPAPFSKDQQQTLRVAIDMAQE
jgi:hypothetical protein